MAIFVSFFICSIIQCSLLLSFWKSGLTSWMSVIGINYKYHTPVPTLYTEHVNTLHIYIVSQKTTLMLHIITSTHINRFWECLAEMLLMEYAIEWWCAIPPLLTNVSALPGGNMNPVNCLLSDSGKLGIRRDHPHCMIEMKFCIVGVLQEVVQRFEFHQNWPSGFGAVPFPID